MRMEPRAMERLRALAQADDMDMSAWLHWKITKAWEMAALAGTFGPEAKYLLEQERVAESLEIDARVTAAQRAEDAEVAAAKKKAEAFWLNGATTESALQSVSKSTQPIKSVSIQTQEFHEPPRSVSELTQPSAHVSKSTQEILTCSKDVEGLDSRGSAPNAQHPLPVVVSEMTPVSTPTTMPDISYSVAPVPTQAWRVRKVVDARNSGEK